MNDEQDVQVEQGNLDERVARYLTRQSQKFSRRGAMVKIGKTLLQLSGLALVPLLPSLGCDETPVGSCDWTTCGMCGVLCTSSSSCCGGSGGTSRCPNCTTHGGAWVGCCYDSSTCQCQNGTMFSYQDCIATSSTNVSACRGNSCNNGCNQGVQITVYPFGAPYACTIVTSGGTCNACNGPFGF